MTDIPHLSLSDYRYDLPDDRIAETPLEQRDASRLLVCNAQEGTIDDRLFTDLPDLIPSTALLIANDTRVVRARIIFHKESGARVEIFLLEPLDPSRDPGRALAAHGRTRWLCLVGGARKIRRSGRIALSLGDVVLEATIESRDEETSVVRFEWSPAELTFGELLERAGRIPLPPYIRREAGESDSTSYQTIYAASEGAVAAPTAGLHFTHDIVERMARRGIRQIHVTLHVGAGTFRPVQTDDPAGHRMHEEMFAVSREALLAMIDQAGRRARSERYPIVMVGTTTLRTMESLYWAGVRLGLGEIAMSDGMLMVEQWDPYRLRAEQSSLPELHEALERVLQWSDAGGRPITGRTSIMIVPGYDFRSCDALLTNFHQPESTLILLVAAFLGDPLWRRVYDHALRSGYRFLSYGDSSLLVRSL
jgi:S-adenosylmethionine:tRNA ribosyltransferase-isomerase